MTQETKQSNTFKRGDLADGVVRYHQIYPYSPLPVLAKDYDARLPRRAKLFCPPFREGKEAGFYLFSPIDFSFCLADDYMAMRFDTESGKKYEVQINRESSIGGDDLNRKIHLKSISPTVHAIVSNYYENRLSEDAAPFLEFYNYLFYLGREEEPFRFWILVYIGGIIETTNRCKVMVKHPANVLLDHPFVVFDGVVDSGRWPGTLNIGIKPLTMNKWVHVSKDVPLCQVVGLNHEITTLEVIPSHKVESTNFNWPLEWYFSKDNLYKKKPGQYQRHLGISPNV